MVEALWLVLGTYPIPTMTVAPRQTWQGERRLRVSNSMLASRIRASHFAHESQSEQDVGKLRPLVPAPFNVHLHKTPRHGY